MLQGEQGLQPERIIRYLSVTHFNIIHVLVRFASAATSLETLALSIKNRIPGHRNQTLGELTRREEHNVTLR